MPHMHFNEFNWIAVIVAALAAFMVGGVWYQALFGKVWIRLQGFSDEQVAKMKAEMSPPKFFGGMIVSYVVLAFMMETIIVALGTNTAMGGASVGFHVWLAIAAVGMTHHLASGKRIGAFFIDAGCEFVYTLIMGAILGAWR